MAINIIPIAIMAAGVAYLVSKKKSGSESSKDGGKDSTEPVIRNVEVYGMVMRIVNGECTGLDISTIDSDAFHKASNAFAEYYNKTNSIPNPPTFEWAEKYTNALFKSFFPRCKFPPTFNSFLITGEGDPFRWDDFIDSNYKGYIRNSIDGIFPINFYPPKPKPD